MNPSSMLANSATPSITAAEIARRLCGKKSGKGWAARCPAHDDQSPSLSVTEQEGKVLVHCFAGCSQAAVIAALKVKGLWPQREQQRSRIVAEYSYQDEDGRLLYQVVRLEPKDFFQRRPDGYGGWINKKGERQVLYHLREVLDAPIVFVVEGEKDVEALRSHGFVATTNAGGSEAPWLPQYTEFLHGRDVIVIPDNDKPGWKRARVVCRALLRHAASLTVLGLDGAKDVAEWFSQGHGELELIALIERQGMKQ